jgi:hypothetical protein
MDDEHRTIPSTSMGIIEWCKAVQDELGKLRADIGIINRNAEWAKWVEQVDQVVKNKKVICSKCGQNIDWRS